MFSLSIFSLKIASSIFIWSIDLSPPFSNKYSIHTHTLHLMWNSRLFEEKKITKKKMKNKKENKSLDSEYIENGVSLFIRIFVTCFDYITSPEGVSTEW